MLIQHPSHRHHRHMVPEKPVRADAKINSRRLVLVEPAKEEEDEEESENLINKSPVRFNWLPRRRTKMRKNWTRSFYLEISSCYLDRQSKAFPLGQLTTLLVSVFLIGGRQTAGYLLCVTSFYHQPPTSSSTSSSRLLLLLLLPGEKQAGTIWLSWVK